MIKRLLGVLLGLAIVFGGVTAAEAAPVRPLSYCSPSVGCSGNPPSSYCSSSVGCYIDPKTKQPKHVTVGPKLTKKEQRLREDCYLRVAGSGSALAGGILGKNVLAILGGVFNGYTAINGPCKDFLKSTARFRK